MKANTKNSNMEVFTDTLSSNILSQSIYKYLHKADTKRVGSYEIHIINYEYWIF